MPALPRLIPGARLVLTDSPVEWLALPTDLAAWVRLVRLLSRGKLRARKGDCHLTRADLAEGCTGMVLIALPPDPLAGETTNEDAPPADTENHISPAPMAASRSAEGSDKGSDGVADAQWASGFAVSGHGLEDRGDVAACGAWPQRARYEGEGESSGVASLPQHIFDQSAWQTDARPAFALTVADHHVKDRGEAAACGAWLQRARYEGEDGGLVVASLAQGNALDQSAWQTDARPAFALTVADHHVKDRGEAAACGAWPQNVCLANEDARSGAASGSLSQHIPDQSGGQTDARPASALTVAGHRFKDRREAAACGAWPQRAGYEGAGSSTASSSQHRADQSSKQADASQQPRAGSESEGSNPSRPDLLDHITELARRYPGQCYIGAAPRYDGRDGARLDALFALSQSSALPMVALGDVLMHRAARRPLADVLTCLRMGLTIDSIGRHRLPNAERRLKPGAEMARMFARYPEAIRRTVEIADRCTFKLDDLRYQYPLESDGEPAQTRLARLTREGMAWRYPQGAPPQIVERVQKELTLIAEVEYAPYFLTVHDIVQFARSRGILCQGRGSAANSVVCYLLGITEVPPETITLIFERFISKERGEPPDIDVDFEHERREEVIQWIYDRYGRHRAGLTATVIHFRSRAAIREVGKVMGLSQDVLACVTGQLWGSSSDAPTAERLRAAGLNPDDRRTLLTLRLIGEIIGFPRHLSQHVGGFVITEGRLDELCPIENAAMEGRTVIEWDKDDIDALGLLKVDVLALGMLTAIRKAFGLLADHRGLDLTLATVPPEDPRVYDMLCRADAIGVFQVESRAQLNFLPRMQPRNMYDLVCEVAIVRPGPIQGGMVHPFLRRRRGLEEVEDLGPAMNKVLGRTYGVPLFQEQAMQIAVVAAGFSPAEADRLRRSLATFKRMGTIGGFRDRFVSGMLERGYDPDFAARCFAQIEGFGSYGFPESHSASFARLVYISAWLKCHHQAAFTCALLNSQPMGFYAPAQLVRDAREAGVEVRPVSVNDSAWDCTLEARADGELALRLGFRQIKGMRAEDAGWIVAARGNGYPDVESLWRRAGVGPDGLARLAEGDAFASVGLTRRQALWDAQALKAPAPLPLFGPEGEGAVEPEVTLPRMSMGQEVIEDYLSMRLSLRAHPLELLRPGLPESLPHAHLPEAKGRATVSGLVITRQRPGTASGVIFLTLEDETGVANVVVWKGIYARFRKAVLTGRLLRVTGKVQREGAVIHLIAERIEDISDRLIALGRGDTPAPPRRSTAHSYRQSARHPREQAKQLFPSRDFH
ncbi:MAG: error-prone DNA polymerase [Paracoccus sp. (in: a-proteobacteria)]|nr:error-prone DNA polymerase [Paracoccus sp. (in: a-proteobacteria)]